MVKGRLPDEAPVRLGPVALPAGKLIIGNQGDHVAWATVDPVPESGRVWAALSELHSQTGLVPIQLDGLRGDMLHLPMDRAAIDPNGLRPWDNGEFTRPEDPREADRLDAGALLKDLWRDWVSWPDEDDPESMDRRVPFTRGVGPDEDAWLIKKEA